jgi:endonuclease/exonuclease/phosphatase family metal-dependent hydrolase
MRAPRFLLLSAVLLALAAGCGSDDDGGGGGVTPIPYQDDGKLTVMTRNLYLGADLDAVVAAGQSGDPVAFATATTAAWNAVQANRFDLRAERIADEILATLPDVVGLQEVSLWRTQTPGDFATGNAVAASTVAIDYLQILLSALSARGLTYVPALPAGQTEPLALFDVEVPVATGQDVRLTDRDVIIVREGVPVANARAGVYENLLGLTLFGGTVQVERGWGAATVTIGAQPITVFNTHLEAFAPEPRVAQAGELATRLDGETGRVVLVGDLNSTPGTEGHLAMTDAGFADAWTAVGAGAGLTCCFAADLSQPRSVDDLTTRIDYVLARGATGQLVPQSAQVVGEEDADRTASGLWPSDHAGVVATLAP